MAEEKVKKKEKPSKNDVGQPLDEDTRFRYIGFEVFGKSQKDFFKSEEEKKKYEQAVAEYEKKSQSPFRDFTAVRQELLTMKDKIALTISSIVMIISAFLPWMTFKSSWVEYSFPGLFGFFQASKYMPVIDLFNPTIKLFIYIPAVLAVLAFIFGILTLVSLYLPAKSKDNYLKRLKRVMGLQWWPLAAWLAFFIFSVVGTHLPFGEWMAEHYGVKGIGSTVNIVTFTSLAGIGVWMSIAGMVLNSVKANDF